MKPVRYLAAARLDLTEAVEFYGERDPELAERFLRAVEDAIAESQEFPNAGRPGRGRSRERRLRAFPFTLVYRAKRTELLIVAVPHDLFAQLRLDPDLDTLAWPTGADLAPEFLYDQVKETTSTEQKWYLR